MQKQTIKNRKDQNVVVVVNKAENQKGLAFVMHGLSGFKEQPHIQTFAEAFKEKGFTTVLFDTTHSFGESDGNYEDATPTSYYEDLEDVIGWAKTQGWYEEPFYLAGHSIGSLCIALYAEKHPYEVKGIAPTSTMVSGTLSNEAKKKYMKEEFEKWKETGWHISESRSKPGVIRKLKWSFVEDSLKYDLLPQAEKLTMPVLLIVGEKDESTPPEHQELLYNALPGPKELHIIKGAQHTFRDPEHLKQIKGIFLKWIDSIS